jgi:hypothetical protein
VVVNDYLSLAYISIAYISIAYIRFAYASSTYAHGSLHKNLLQDTIQVVDTTDRIERLKCILHE